jgi:hypothetical protein
MFEGNIEVCGKEIPRTLLGTSPFIGAPQFGHRSRLYQLDLYNQPKNILKIIRKAHNLGVKGIQLIPYPPVVKALKWAQDEGSVINIVGTVRPDQEYEDIKLLSELGASSMVLHAVTTDRCDWNFMEKNLQLINDEKAVAGLVTHLPFRTTEKLLKSPILDLFQIYMFPMNPLGYLMDCDTYGAKKRTEIREMILKLNKTVIAKKIMAAGILKPDEAFNYLKTLDFIDIVALGIASEEEARETFNLLSLK